MPGTSPCTTSRDTRRIITCCSWTANPPQTRIAMVSPRRADLRKSAILSKPTAAPASSCSSPKRSNVSPSGPPAGRVRDDDIATTGGNAPGLIAKTMLPRRATVSSFRCRNLQQFLRPPPRHARFLRSVGVSFVIVKAVACSGSIGRIS